MNISKKFKIATLITLSCLASEYVQAGVEKKEMELQLARDHYTCQLLVEYQACPGETVPPPLYVCFRNGEGPDNLGFVNTPRDCASIYNSGSNAQNQ